ncbi:MAG: hypothetical protein WAT93_13670 [Pontixanthobacter sp.]
MSKISDRAIAASRRVEAQEFHPDVTSLDHLREVWRVAALRASEARHIAERLAEGKKSKFEGIVLDLIAAGQRATMAERMAATSEDYAEYLDAMIDARRAARDLQIDADNADRIYWQRNNDEARQRAEMRRT